MAEKRVWFVVESNYDGYSEPRAAFDNEAAAEAFNDRVFWGLADVLSLDILSVDPKKTWPTPEPKPVHQIAPLLAPLVTQEFIKIMRGPCQFAELAELSKAGDGSKGDRVTVRRPVVLESDVTDG